MELLLVLAVPIGIWLVVAIVRSLRKDSVIIDGVTYEIDSKGNHTGKTS